MDEPSPIAHSSYIRTEPINMRALIVYASHEGQTERITSRMSQRISDNSIPTDVYDVVKMPADEVQIDMYDAVVIGSPLHYGRHDPRVEWCIREYRQFLCEVPTAFFSVSLGIVSDFEKDRRAAKWLADEFLREVHWEPSMRACFAGALRYSRYGWLKQHVMHWIAKRSGDQTEINRDYEYTDWERVDEFAIRFARFAHSCKQPEPVDPRFSWTMQPRRPYSVISHSDHSMK